MPCVLNIILEKDDKLIKPVVKLFIDTPILLGNPIKAPIVIGWIVPVPVKVYVFCASLYVIVVPTGKRDKSVVRKVFTE
jgi:hypothetical protein